MKTTLLAALLLGLATQGVVCAQEAPAAAAAPATQPGTLVNLKFVETKPNQAGVMYCAFNIDKDGKATWPFANPIGHMTVQYRDGLIQADTNGDGVVDQKDDAAVKPEQATLRVAATVGGREVKFPLQVMQVEKNDNSSYVVVGSRAALEATFGGRTIRFLDQMASGGFMRNRGYMQVSDGKTPGSGDMVQFSRTLALGDKLWQFEVVTENQQLRFTPYTGPIASVTVKTDMPGVGGRFCLSHVEQTQVGIGELGKPMKFVPGDYRLQYVMLMPQRNQNDGTSTLVATFRPTSKPLTVGTGEVAIKIGAPFKMDFTASRDGANVEITDLQLAGVAGELYRPSADEARGEIFAAYIRSAGKEEVLTKLSYG